MDRLDDEDIGIIWGRHYPKRTEHASSMSLCLTLAMIIKQRAKSLDQYSNWPAKLGMRSLRLTFQKTGLIRWKLSRVRAYIMLERPHVVISVQKAGRSQAIEKAAFPSWAYL
jgi:hypothetical protein